MRIFYRTYRVLDWIFDNLIVAISNICLMIFTILVFTDVVSRYLFEKSFAQISEYSIFLFVWMVFLMIGKVLKENKHINIGILYDYLKMKRRWRLMRILNIYFYITVLIFSVVFLYFSIPDTFIYYRVGYHSTLDYVPYYWIWHLAFPIGLASLLFYSIRALIISLADTKKDTGDE